MSTPFIPLETAELTWINNLPFSRRFNDIYFSHQNGIAETEHVFIAGNNLIERWQTLAAERFVIAETGFGSGLNFLLSWSLWLKYAPPCARLCFISCEKYPLKKEDLMRCLALWPELNHQARQLLDVYPISTPGFHTLQFEEGRVDLMLLFGDATESLKQLLVCGDAELEGKLRSAFIDAWFLDGFAPAKNEAMWSMELFQNIALLSKPGTTLATFTSATIVKQNLQAVGFNLQKIKGFGRKREMIVGEFEKLKLGKSKYRATPWHAPTPLRYKQKKALIIGAGLAGCFTAHALAKRGWEVCLADKSERIGQGASGNTQAVLYPNLSAYRSPLTVFMLASFLYSYRFYSLLLNKYPIGNLSGILQLAFDEQQNKAQASLKNWLLAYPELGRLLDSQAASALAGVALKKGGLFIPCAGWINAQALCQLLSETPGIQWHPNQAIDSFDFAEGKWHAGTHSAEILIIANGFEAAHFSQTSHLSIKAIRGQMTTIASNAKSSLLNLPLCSDGHVLPMNNNGHAVGATYHLDSIDTTGSAVDDSLNIKRLEKMNASLDWSENILASWTGIRGATSDYLPLVGPVPEAAHFMQQFEPLSLNSKRWISQVPSYYPGLYMCAAFGSRGLTTIPLSAEWLAASICHEFSCLPRSIIQSLSPARFLLKAIIRNQ